MKHIVEEFSQRTLRRGRSARRRFVVSGVAVDGEERQAGFAEAQAMLGRHIAIGDWHPNDATLVVLENGIVWKTTDKHHIATVTYGPKAPAEGK